METKKNIKPVKEPEKCSKDYGTNLFKYKLFMKRKKLTKNEN